MSGAAAILEVQKPAAFSAAVRFDPFVELDLCIAVAMVF
jgi:hypothetical protein